MPVTRASAKESVRQNDGASASKSLKATNKPPRPDQEVIEIDDSDDEEDPEPINVAGSNKRTLPQAASESSKRARTEASDKKLFHVNKELIAIAKNATGQLLDLDAKVKAAQDKESKAVARLVEVEAALAKANARILDIVDLQSHASCMICETLLWRPWSLSECGHTFCERCLFDWFEAIRKKFMEKNPGFVLNDSHPYTSPAHIARLPAAIQPILNVVNQFPRPHYHCPLCRNGVNRQPSHNYSFKTIVGVIGTSAGEEEPEDVVGKGKGKARDAGNGPWARFFRSE